MDVLTKLLPQLGAIGVLVGVAVMTIFGRGVVGYKMYQDVREDRDQATNAALKAIEASSTVSAALARLDLAVESTAAATQDLSRVVRTLVATVEELTRRIETPAGGRRR